MQTAIRRENVVKIFGYFLIGSTPDKLITGLIQEECKMTLEDFVLRNLRRSTNKERFLLALPILRQVLDALVELSTHGFLHRDIKPNNIFIGFDNKVKVGDYGLATRGNKLIPSEESKIEVVSFYIPKDLYQLKFDVYSCGATLFMVIIGMKRKFNHMEVDWNTRDYITQQLKGGSDDDKEDDDVLNDMVDLCFKMVCDFDKRINLSEARSTVEALIQKYENKRIWKTID